MASLHREGSNLSAASVRCFIMVLDVYDHVFDYDEEEANSHNCTELNNNHAANPNPYSYTNVNNNPNPDRSIRSSTSRMDLGPGRKPSGRGRSLE